MPFIDDAELTDTGSTITLPRYEGDTSEAKKVKPTWSETFGASVRQDNIIVNMQGKDYEQRHRQLYKPQIGFNPLETLEPEFSDEKSMDYLSTALSPSELEYMKQRLRSERADRETVARADTWTSITAGFAAGSTDLTNYIPGVGLVGKGGKLAKAAITAGDTAAVMTGQEAALHYSQEYRTPEESVANIALGTAFGGVVGGVFAKGAKSTPSEDALVDAGSAVTRDVPAEEVVSPSIPTDIVAGEGSAISTSKVLDSPIATSPLTATPNSVFATLKNERARALVEPLTRNSILKEGNVELKASSQSVETVSEGLKRSGQDTLYTEVLNKSKIKSYQKEAQKLIDEDPDTFADILVRAGAASAADVADVTNLKKFLTGATYKHLVTDAINHGDTIFKSVRESADIWQAKIRAPMFDRGVSAGVWDATQRDTRAPSVWSRERIRYLEEEFKQLIRQDAVLRGHLMGLDATDPQVVRAATEGVDNMFSKLISENTDAEQPFMSRQALIDPATAQAFLETDIEVLTNRYLSQAAPTIALAERGIDRTMRNLKEQLSDEYLAMARDVPEVERKAIQDEYDRLKDHLEAVKDRLFDRSRSVATEPWERALANSRVLASTAQLSNMLVASTTDVGRAAFFSNLKSAPSTLKVISKFVSSKETRRLAKEDAKLMAYATEGATQDFRTMAAIGIEDINRFDRKQGKISQAINTVASALPTISGMKYWNTWLKRIVGTTYNHHITKQMLDYDNASNKFKVALAQKGVGEAEAHAIQAQFKNHAKEIDGIWHANTSEWDDAAARESFHNVIRDAVDETIMTPGAGHTALWTDGSEVGKAIGQYSTFLQTANEQMVVHGIQHRDANTYLTFLSMVVMGGLNEQFKLMMNGKEPMDDPLDFFLTGVEKSGYLGMAGWAWDKVHGVTAGTSLSVPTLSGFVGDQREYGFNRGVFESVAPVASWLSTGITAGAGVADGDVTEKDLNKLSRVVPFASSYLFDVVIDPIEDTIGTNIGR